MSHHRLRAAGAGGPFQRQSLPSPLITPPTTNDNNANERMTLHNTSLSNISVATTVNSSYYNSTSRGAATTGGASSNPPTVYGDNIRVCARIRPLNAIEEELNATLSKKGIRDSTFDCCRYPANTSDVIELRVPDNLLLATPVEFQGGRTPQHHNNGNDDDPSYLTRILGGGGDGVLSPSKNGLSPSSSSAALLQSVPVSSHLFTFSRVFNQASTQQEVYEDVGAPIIKDVVNGYNGTIFVYGQTGSGKTHTMMGAPSGSVHHGHHDPHSSPPGSLSRSSSRLRHHPYAFSSSGNPNSHHHSNQPAFSTSHQLDAPMYDLDISHEAGIVPRAIEGLFECMYAAPSTTSFALTMYFVEIYMERVRDLLVADPSASNLPVREDPKAGSFYVDGCITPEVSKPSEIMTLLNYGLQNRATAATKMNHSSSRSHCLLCIQVKVMDSLEGNSRHGKLFLIDLAGSEKVAKTKAEGQQLEEAKLINKSLTTLGHVINNLTDRNAAHVPYRDSKLTRILQEALGGNSRTTLVVCCSPSVRNIQETLSTLRFGQRAKSIKNRAVINKDLNVEDLVIQLEAAKREIELLRRGGANGHSPCSPSVSDAGDWLTGTSGTIRKLHGDEDEYELIALRNDKVDLIRNVQRLEDELRDAIEASQTTPTNTNAVAQLQLEIRLWEREYTALHHKNAASTARLKALRDLRSTNGDTLAQLQGHIANLRNTVKTLKRRCEIALKFVKDENERRNLQEEELRGVIVSLQYDRDHPPRPTEVRVPVVDEAAVRKHEAALVALREANARIDFLEEQKGEVERSLRDAMDTQGALSIEIQLLQKKLEIRTERIETLKRGVMESHESYRLLEIDGEEKQQQLRSSMLEARGDAAHWREKYTAIKQEYDELVKERLSHTFKRGASPELDALLNATLNRSAVVRGTSTNGHLIGGRGASSHPQLDNLADTLLERTSMAGSVGRIRGSGELPISPFQANEQFEE